MSEYVTRQVLIDDAAEIAALHVLIWQRTYFGMIDQRKLDSLTVEDRETRWREVIIPNLDRQERAGVRTRCAVHNATGRIVGFATGGTPRDGEAPCGVELWALNVHPDHHGSGVATQLLRPVIGNLPAYLWVVRDNARAVAFYRKNGFELDGGYRFDDDWACYESRLVRE